MPQLGPVAGATVQIFKQFPGVAPVPVSAATATTDGTGRFTLANCDTALVASQQVNVPGLDVQAPGVTIAAHSITVDDQVVTVPDFDVNITGRHVHVDSISYHGVTVPGFDVDVPAFDWTVRGHTFTLKGATTTTPKVYVPPATIHVAPRTLTLPLPVPAVLTIRVVVAGQTFEQPYTPPIIVLNGAINVDLNVIGGASVFTDTLHRIAIAAQRAAYEWQATPALPGHIARLPPQELPPARYAERGAHDALAIANGTVAGMQTPYDPLAVGDFDKLAPVIAAAGVLPIGTDALHDDAAFAAQRLAGVNPMVIARLSGPAAIPADFARPEFAAAFQATFGVALAQAATDGTLYVCDYTILKDLDPGGPRFFRAPIALFVQLPPLGRVGVGPLVPAGIFLGGQFHATSNPIVTPAHPAWPVAKLVVQCADLNLHEMKSHLHDTHLVMEAAAVAMRRTMFAGHPIAELLSQHFHVMLVQGAFARSVLMAPGGTVDKVLGTGLAGSWEIVKRARAAWTFAGAALEADLAHRNMANAPVVYPYRDDARDILGVIQRFVASYVAEFYRSDAAVHGDGELQDWLIEMAAPDRGNLGAIPAVQTTAALTQLVAQIIFTCSAQHSALNYPQYDYFGRAANMPAAIWHDPITAFATPAPAIEAFLPSKASAIAQIDLAYQLSDYRYDQLGDYREHVAGAASYAWLHPASRQLARRFRDDLAGLATAMHTRNSRRSPALRYAYLMPENILNSISI